MLANRLNTHIYWLSIATMYDAYLLAYRALNGHLALQKHSLEMTGYKLLLVFYVISLELVQVIKCMMLDVMFLDVMVLLQDIFTTFL